MRISLTTRIPVFCILQFCKHATSAHACARARERKTCTIVTRWSARIADGVAELIESATVCRHLTARCTTTKMKVNLGLKVTALPSHENLLKTSGPILKNKMSFGNYDIAMNVVMTMFSDCVGIMPSADP